MAREEIVQRKAAAQEFVQRWKGRGYEKGETAPFWLDLLQNVIGMEDAVTNIRFEKKTSERGYIDATIRDAKTVIEQKSLGINLDTPPIASRNDGHSFRAG